MKTGILESWYLTKIFKSKDPIEYMFAIWQYTFYKVDIFNFNLRHYFDK